MIKMNERHEKTPCYSRSNEIDCNFYANFFFKGSPEERAVVRKAVNLSSKRDFDIYNEQPKKSDVEYEYIAPNEDLMIGSDFDVKLRMRNTSSEEKKIYVTMAIRAAYYTSITAFKLDGQKEKEYTLGPKEGNDSYKSEHYLYHLI